MAGKVQLPWPDSPSFKAAAGSLARESAMTGREPEHPVYTEAAQVGDEVRISSVRRKPLFSISYRFPVLIDSLCTSQEFVRHPKFSSVHHLTGKPASNLHMQCAKILLKHAMSAGRLVRKGDFGGWWVRFEGECQDRFCSTGGLSGACYELCKVWPAVSETKDIEEGSDDDSSEKDASLASTSVRSRNTSISKSLKPQESLSEGGPEEQSGQHMVNTPSISANVSDVTDEVTDSMCPSPSISVGLFSNCGSVQTCSASGQIDSYSRVQEKPARPPRSSVTSDGKNVPKEYGKDVTSSIHCATTPRVLPSKSASMSFQEYKVCISDLKQDNAELRLENAKCKQALTDLASRRVFADSEAEGGEGQGWVPCYARNGRRKAVA